MSRDQPQQSRDPELLPYEFFFPVLAAPDDASRLAAVRECIEKLRLSAACIEVGNARRKRKKGEAKKDERDAGEAKSESSSSGGDVKELSSLSSTDKSAAQAQANETSASASASASESAAAAEVSGGAVVEAETDKDDMIEDEVEEAAKRMAGVSASAKQTVARLGRRLIEAHGPAVVRLAHECPLPEVGKEFMALYEEVREIETLVLPSPVPSPSRFVHPSNVVAIVPENAETRQLFEDVFFSTGRLSHLDQLLGWHPTFMRVHVTALHFAMNDDDGPLPISWRSYIAMMAASRHHCDYLIDMLERDFVMNNGDERWLAGVEFATDKIQRLVELNTLLAHRPWQLTQDHIAALVKSETDPWSISEVVHALVIMTTYHALAGLVRALGVTPEVDSDVAVRGGASGTAGASSLKMEYEGELVCANDQASIVKNNEQLMDILKVDSANLEKLLEQESDTTGVDAFDNAVTAADDVKTAREEEEKVAAAEAEQCVKSAKYRAGLDLKYVNFDVKNKAHKVFHTHDYSWKEHGFALLNRFYRDLGPLLDEEFDLIYTLTYKKMNKAENIDTTMFRRAIWHYVQRLFGMCADDYDYRKANKVLKENKDLKRYLKKTVCTPETITARDFFYIGFDFDESERCHIALLAMEARRQASLLYGLHAVMRFMGNH